MTRQTRKPRNIQDRESGLLESWVIERGIPVPPGWTMYVTDSNCGRARYNVKTVTIPLWAWSLNKANAKKHNNNPEYRTYYICHELAHAWVDHKELNDDSTHGRKFYEEFKRLCPPALWHFETEYKPRDAKRAGISTDPKTNIINADTNPRAKTRTYEAKAAGDASNESAYERYINSDPRLAANVAALRAEGYRQDYINGYVRGWAKLETIGA